MESGAFLDFMKSRLLHIVHPPEKLLPDVEWNGHKILARSPAYLDRLYHSIPKSWEHVKGLLIADMHMGLL